MNTGSEFDTRFTHVTDAGSRRKEISESDGLARFHEPPREALERIRRSGLSLTNPKDLYWMIKALNEKFYCQGNFYYPIRTACDGEMIDVHFYCPFEPALSPHYTQLYNTRDERSQLYAIPPLETDMGKYNRINCEKTASLTAPHSSYEDTQMVAYFYSMMYYLNDQTAHLKLPEKDIQPDLVDLLNDHLLLYLSEFLDIFEPREDEDLERIWAYLEFYQPYFEKKGQKIVLAKAYQGQTPPQIRLIRTMTNYIAANFAPTKNTTQLVYEIIKYIKGIKQEIAIRRDKTISLSLAEYDAFRDKVTSSPMAHAVTDLTQPHTAHRFYREPLFIELENLACEIITYFNDVCTCDRERRDADPFNSVFILRDLHGLTYAQACDQVVQHAHDKMKRFLKNKELLLESATNDEERRGVAQMIKTREDSLIGYVCHEVCCVQDGYARDHKPRMKEYMEGTLIAFLQEEAASI